MTTLLDVCRLTKTYRDGATLFNALKGVDLTLHSGDFVALTGPSGCGKTTLLNIVGCIEMPDTGEVKFEGEPVPYGKMSALDRFRRNKVGLIFQDFNLITVLTAYENVELPLLYSSVSPAERRRRVTGLLAAVGLEAHLHHRPGALSGGQCQRVAVARAMVNHPRLVLADEPTANLDSASAHEVMELMHQMNRELGTTLLVSTHDPRVMDQLQRQLPMMEGMIHEDAAVSV